MPNAPACVGTHELDNTTCNGDPLGSRVEDVAPCAWRNRCVGLKAYCAENDQQSALIVASLTYPALVALCENQIETHKIADGVVGALKPPAPAPELALVPEAPSAKPKRTLLRGPRPSEKHMVPPQRKHEKAHRIARVLSQESVDLYNHFEMVFRDFFRDRRFASGKRVLVRPGTFYPVDRTEASRYVSWYCTAARGRDHAIACVKIKPRKARVDIQLPVSLEELRKFLGAKSFKKLSAREFKDGQFRVTCTQLDREGIALAAETIRKMVETDILALPE